MQTSFSSTSRTQYDEPHLFEMYFMHFGNIPKMLQTISVLSPEQRVAYPARPTLYEYEKKFEWKERYRKFKDSVVKEMESGVALHYDRLNQIANLAAAGLLRRMVLALQSGTEKDLRIFTMEALKIIWEVTRCERGLPTHVSKTSHKFSGIEQSENALRNAGLGHVAEAIKKASPEVLKTMLDMMGGDVFEMPGFLQ